MTAWDVILPFLRPIEPLLRDSTITDILIHGSASVFVERAGVMSEVPEISIPEKSLHVAMRNVARQLGDEINDEQPILDARLPDGSRLAAVLAPVSVNGTAVAIRKFQPRPFTLDDLVRKEAMPGQVAQLLADAMRQRQSVLISGATGTGKTSLLNALAETIPPHERIVVIEDTSEIQLDRQNLVRLEARRAQPGLQAITVRDLVVATLRLRPDRILLGEIRREEAFDVLQALNTGHRGTLSTTHANSAAESLERFATCVLMADTRLSYRTVCRQIALGLQLLVHMGVRDRRRQVMEVVRVKGYQADLDHYVLETLYAA